MTIEIVTTGPPRVPLDAKLLCSDGYLNIADLTPGSTFGSRYETLVAADAAAILSGQTLVITGEWELIENIEFFAPVYHAGLFTGTSEITVTFSGGFRADDSQHFFGGIVVNGIKKAKPEWWGAKANGAVDDSQAIYAAINSVKNKGTVEISNGIYACTQRIGTIVNANCLSIVGKEGSEIRSYIGANVDGLLQFGDATRNESGFYNKTDITVFDSSIVGIKFTSGTSFSAGQWHDQMPLSINTAQNFVVKECDFSDFDFAAIDFGARCINCTVDSCVLSSSQIEALHRNYGVRIFCSSSDIFIDEDISPTDPATGILKAGYSLPSDTGYLGHEGINVINSTFINVSHGVMTAGARNGIIANNKFINCSTRTVSLSTFSNGYSVYGNKHFLDTNVQTSSGVSTFIGIGQASYGNKIDNETFEIIGAINNAVGFVPIKAYLNSHEWVISNCKFVAKNFNINNPMIAVEQNADGSIVNNSFDGPLFASNINLLPAYGMASPGFQQGKILIKGNEFLAAIQPMIIYDTTSDPSAIVIADNISHISGTRFVATSFTDAGKVAKLYLDGNKIIGSPARYIDNTTAHKAKILHSDILEIYTRLATGGAANPSTTPVTFDFSDKHIPACFLNGTKTYQFTTYGDRSNSQLSTDFYFQITGETVTSISGDIIRNAGSSFQIGYVGLKVFFLPLNI